MADLALAFDPSTGAADLCFEDDDLVLDAGLQSIVLASLLTDARAHPVDLPDDDPDRRGWWSDALSATPWGSLLWTLRRSKALTETLRKAEDYARTALAWMIDDGIVESFDVVATRTDDVGSGATLALTVTAYRPDGSRETLLFDGLWDATIGARP